MISPATTEVLLESAWFEPKSVRRTSKRLGLSTDASYRFERGADVEAARAAIDRAASLLAQVAGGEVLPGLIDIRSSEAPARRRLRLRSRRLGTLLGMPVDPSRAGAALTSLGFEVAKAADGLEVTVPAHRQDVGGEADLVEEVARSIGYDAIPETIPHLPGTGAVNRFAHRREETLRSSLLASGFSEAITYAFVGRDLDGLLGEEGIAAVALANPMAEGQDVLRSTLLPGLALAVRHNLNHGVRDVHLFEVGRVFRRADTTEEILMAGLAVTGLARPRHWSEPSREAGLHDLKGAIEEALARLSLPATIEPLHGASPFRPGTAARILAGGRGAGRMGILSQAAAERLGIKAPVALAEIDLTRLFAAEETPMTFRPLPRFPSASRDLALVVRRGTAWRDLERAILDAGGDLVARVTVFDRYEGTSLPEGHVSLAVSIVYQHPDRTLGAAEVQAAESKVLASLGSRFGVTLRA
jgi:phenylalanyl-tRNA synthetase beta chain